MNRFISDGNSLTVGAEITYPKLLIESLGATWEYRNFGVGGQDTADMIADADTQIDPLFDSRKRRDVVICWEGGNDIGSATAADAYDRLVAYCQGRQSAGFEVIILTLSISDNTEAWLARRIELNSLLIANWATFADAIVRIDQDPYLGDDGNPLDTDYFVDGVHMTPAGYAIVADLVKTAIL